MVDARITIVGMGAIGAVYASALKRGGIRVKVAADPQRVERYLRQGVFLNSERLDLQYYTPTVLDDEADWVIIATKSNGLLEALDLIAPIVGANTQILPLLNGLTSEKICAQRYGTHRVLHGYFIGHTAVRLGNQIKQDGKFRTFFGEPLNNATFSDRVEQLKAIFTQCAISHTIPQDMISAQWQKWVINIGMNQATAVLRCTYGHLQRNKEAREYMENLMLEAVAVAKAMDIADADHMFARAVAGLNTLNPEDGSSMYQDVISGRRTEVDLFAHTLTALASDQSIKAPYNFHAGTILDALPYDI
jgi:2-dehydropantoate 2-reductase